MNNLVFCYISILDINIFIIFCVLKFAIMCNIYVCNFAIWIYHGRNFRQTYLLINRPHHNGYRRCGAREKER